MKPTAKKLASRVAGECLGFRTRSVSRTVTRIFDDALREHGLTIAQYGLLAAIGVLEPVQPAELGGRLNLEKSTLTRNIQLMGERGWVAVTPGSTGRSVHLALTAKGKQALEKAFPAWERAQGTVREILGERLVRALDPRKRET